MADSSTLVDRVKIFVESTGTGPFQLGNALPSFRGSEALVDGLTYSYAVESGSDYEVGRGVYVLAVDQLLREPTLSSNGGAPVSFPANVAVNFTALATDLVAGLAGSGTVTSVQASGGTTGLSFTGGPITGSGTLVLGGTLGVANGGTGGTNAVTAREAIGLGNVDNTSDADKPISTATQTALDDKTDADALESATGAGLVGFKQPGSGTVMRKLNTKLAEFVSVADYLPIGYVVDGSVDYTAEIQACVDNNQYVKFPAGMFLHSRIILKFEGQIIRGDGTAATILYCPAGYGFTNFSGTDADPIGPDWVGDPTFEYLTLRGGFINSDDFNPPANSWAFASGRSKPITTTDINAGIRLKRCYPYTLSNVVIEHFHRGVYASAAALARWDNFLVTDCEVGMWGENGSIWGDAAWQITTHNWMNGRFRNCWIGINGSDFVQCQIIKKTVDFEPCNSGIAITNGADNVWSGYFELCYEGIYRNGGSMGHDVIEDPFFGGSPGAFWGDGFSIFMDSGIGAAGKITLRNGQAAIGGGGIEVLAGRLFRAELCGKTVVFLSPALTPGGGYAATDIGWSLTGGYDDLGLFSGASPTLFTIPPDLDGATIVLRVSIRIDGDATPNDVAVEFLKNGGSFAGTGQYAAVFAFGTTVNFATAPIPVVAGDIFKVTILMNLSRTLPTGNISWMTAEVVK